VDSVFLHPSLSDYILIAGSSLVVRDLQDPHNQHFLTAHDSQITCLAVSNNGVFLASGQRGENSDIVIWNYSSKKAVYRLSEHDHEVALLAFSHDDKLLLSVGNALDGKLFVWNTANGHIVSSLPLVPSVITENPKCMAWGGFVKDIKGRPTTNY
jgi:WD40 repeat protein